MSGPPDYVGVGTMAAGALWWHGLLLEHPGVESRPAEERGLHFFERFCKREMTESDIADYHARFPRAQGRIAGEWTQRYVFDAWTPLLLARAAPRARLLMLVSDPVERYRKKLASVRRDAGDEESYAMADMAARGRYATQLQNLLAYFERDRVLVLQTEQCVADPAHHYARMTRFLGLEDFLPERIAPKRQGLLGRLRGGRESRSAATTQRHEKADLWPELADALCHELLPEAQALAALVPELDLSLWPDLTANVRQPSP